MTERVEDADVSRQLIKGFAAELRQLFKRVDASNNELVAVSARQCAQDPTLDGLFRSTVNDHVRGIRARLPGREWVTAYAKACIEIATRKKIDLGRQGSVEYWQRLHRRTVAALDDTAPFPVVRSHEGIGAPGQAAGPRGTAVDPNREAAAEDGARSAMLALAARPDTGWWQRYRPVVPDWFGAYLSLEAAADTIRSYESTYIPGLLQTEDYAREVLGPAAHGPSEEETRLRLDLRMRRQRRLDGPGAPRLWAVFDLRALRNPAISPETMCGQIEHLVRCAARWNIVIQVTVPPPGQGTVGAPISLLRFREYQFPDIVYLEQADGGVYPCSGGYIDHYLSVIDRLTIKAKSPVESAWLLRRTLLETRRSR